MISDGDDGGGSPLTDIIDNIGFGPWTILHILPAVLAPMATISNLVIGEFQAPPLQFWCADVGDTASHNNSSSSISSSMMTECEVLSPGAVTGSPTLLPCHLFTYNTSTFTSTLTAEFDLVCSRSWYRQLFQVLFTLGSVLGAPAGGLLGDMYGRRSALFFGSIMMAACTVLLSMSSSLEVVLAARFLLGLFSYITFSPALTIGMEVCPTSLRLVYGVVESIPYALVLPLVAGVAYGCRIWRRLQLYTSGPLLLLVLLSCPLVMDESPRWLVAKGRVSACEKTLRRAARMRGRGDQIPEDLHSTLRTAYESEPNDDSLVPKLWSLVSTAEMRKLTFIFLILGLSEGVLYITLPLEANTFRSPFLYMALLGLLELPASVVMVIVGPRCGRVVMATAVSVLLVGLFAAAAVIKAFYGTVEWSLFLVSVVSYVALVVGAQLIILLTTELFPTTVRGVGTSLGMLTNNIGYCIPPFIKAVTPTDMPWIPSAINSVLALLNTFLVLRLPETRKRPLLQTVEDHINYTKMEKEGSVGDKRGRKQ